VRFVALLVIIGLSLCVTPTEPCLAGSVVDERPVIQFDSRDWRAFRSQAIGDTIIVRYLIRGESPVTWTEQVTAESRPLSPEPTGLATAADNFKTDLMKESPLAEVTGLFKSDDEVVLKWKLPDSVTVKRGTNGLIAFKRGIKGMHTLIYETRKQASFDAHSFAWETAFQNLKLFNPEADTAGAAGNFIADTSAMIRVVMRLEAPNFREGDFAGLPRTFFRSGRKYLRAEERPDTARGMQGLFLVAEPDCWIINLLDHTGQHSLDDRPILNAQCPVFSILSKDSLGDLELGEELTYFRRLGARQLPDETIHFVACSIWELPRLNWVLKLYVRRDKGLPYRISRVDTKGQLFAVQYDEYTHGLELRRVLFAPPQGITLLR
jgi:hypothetical protein